MNTSEDRICLRCHEKVADMYEANNHNCKPKSIWVYSDGAFATEHSTLQANESNRYYCMLPIPGILFVPDVRDMVAVKRDGELIYWKSSHHGHKFIVFND
jgi:hypothetical protein